MKRIPVLTLLMCLPLLARAPLFAADKAEKPHIGSTKVNPKDGATMVYVPAGKFTMGSNNGDVDEKPAHRAYLDGYWIYKNDVTVEQYQRFCKATKRAMPPVPEWGWQGDHPIVNVTWYDANAYCRWAGVRLPTEAQWEKAARGTDGRIYPWGNTFDAGKLWCSKAAFADAKSTAPVGSFPAGASPYGCLDMAGNVWQWCADLYGTYDGPTTGQFRDLRGGSWVSNDPTYFRTAHRGLNAPGNIANFNGFRCATVP